MIQNVVSTFLCFVVDLEAAGLSIPGYLLLLFFILQPALQHGGHLLHRRELRQRASEEQVRGHGGEG